MYKFVANRSPTRMCILEQDNMGGGSEGGEGEGGRERSNLVINWKYSSVELVCN